MSDSNDPNDGIESHSGSGSVRRRTYLKSAAVAAAAGVGLSGSASADHYETIQASGQTISVEQGETFENKLIDLSTGESFDLHINGGNTTIRNVGFEGIYRGDGFMIAITNLASDSGDVLIENVYLGDGATKEGADFVHGPGGMFYHRDANVDVTFRYCNVQGYPNNGFYCSNSAYGGSITWEHCYAKNNGVSSYRCADGNDEIVNCVAYNDDTEPYFPGRNESAGRPVWAWNPGAITIEDSDFHSGQGDNTYPYALVAGANGDPSVIDYNSGDFVGDVREANGSDINIASAVGNSPDLTPPSGVPTSAVQAAEGDGSDGGDGGGGTDDDVAPAVVDDFERADPLADYGGATSLYSVESSTVYEGSQAITNDGGDFGSAVSTSGLDGYPSRGDEVHFHFTNAADDNFVACHFLAQSEQDNPDCYSAGIGGAGGWRLWRHEGGSVTEIAQASLPASEQIDGWYRAEVRPTDTTIYADLYDDSTDELLASVQADDTTYSSGGIGFRSAGNGEVWDYAVQEVVDDFERADPLADYGGADGLFGTTTSTVYEGSQALVNDGGDFGSVVSTAGLSGYPDRGEGVTVHFTNAGDDNFVATHFLAQSEQDNPDSYSAGISGQGAWRLWRHDGGSVTTLASQDLPTSDQISGWYRAELSSDASTVYADLYDDANDALLASVQADDTTYSSGGIGFRSAGNGEAWDYAVRGSDGGDGGETYLIDYDEYADPDDVYDVNDNRSGIPPEFVTQPTYSGGDALRLEFSSDQKAANVEYRFPQHSGHDGLNQYDMAEELFVRFQVYPDGISLGTDDTLRIFWLPLTNGSGSSGGGQPDGTNGWSNAIGFANRNGSPAPDGYNFFSYSYHMDGSGDFQMTDEPVWMDQWNEIAGYVRCNTYSGGTANADGVMRYWVNGALAFEDTSMRFTTEDDNLIEGHGPLGYVVGNDQSGNALVYDDHEFAIDYDPGR